MSRGVGGAGAHAGRGAAAEDHEQRLGQAELGGKAGEGARVVERLQVERPGAHVGIAVPGGDQVVARHVGLVAQRHEAGEAEPASSGSVEQGDADTPGLGTDGERSGAWSHGPERRVQPGAAQVAEAPKQLGPTRRMSWARASSASRCSRRAPFEPVSASPAVSTTAGVGAAATEPFDGRLQHPAGGTATTARSTPCGRSDTSVTHSAAGTERSGCPTAGGPRRSRRQQVLEDLSPDTAARPAHSHDGDRRRLEQSSRRTARGRDGGGRPPPGPRRPPTSGPGSTTAPRGRAASRGRTRGRGRPAASPRSR